MPFTSFPPSLDSREITLRFLVSEAERDQIVQAAGSEGLSVSAWLRARALTPHPLPSGDVIVTYGSAES